MNSVNVIPLYLRDGKFRIDEDDEDDEDDDEDTTIWLERLDEFREPTEDYIEVDDELFQLLVENNQIEGGE